MKLDRRTFLRAAGVSLALPWLDALAGPSRGAPPCRAWFASARHSACTPLISSPRQLVEPTCLRPTWMSSAISATTSPVCSNLAHPEVGSSHDSIFSFLTAAPHPERRAGFRNSISLDQFAASQIGGETRFPSLRCRAKGSVCPGPAAVPSCRPIVSRVACSADCSSRGDPLKWRRRFAGCATAAASSMPSALRPRVCNRNSAAATATR